MFGVTASLAIARQNGVQQLGQRLETRERPENPLWSLSTSHCFLPNFQPSGSPQPPLISGSRLRSIGPINLPLADCSDGAPAPGFRGRCGRTEATCTNTTPSVFLCLSFSCRISNRLYRPSSPCPALALREIGPINLPLADCPDDPLAPGFHGRRGRPGSIRGKRLLAEFGSGGARWLA